MENINNKYKNKLLIKIKRELNDTVLNLAKTFHVIRITK